METRLGTGALVLTVHGPAGAVDIVVPPQASAEDVAQEYAAQCRLQFAPTLHTRLGEPLSSEQTLAAAGIRSGDVLAAGGAVRPTVEGRIRPRQAPRQPGLSAVAWFCVAASLGVLAGWVATRIDGVERDVTIGLLAATALLGVVPLGRLCGHRMAVAPAFAAAAAFAVVWEPESERLPTIFGVTALVAAVTAAVGRAMDLRAEETMRVWIVAGVAVFGLTGVAALLHARPEVVWGLLLVLAMLAARFVPGVAVDVPDQYLIDIERLAVTAWSARERPPGRRGRTIVPAGAVATVAARGAKVLTASAVAIWVVAAVSAPMLLATATLPVDRTGAKVLVFLSGAALLLASRSYRHAAARTLLRGAGLTCWVALSVEVLGGVTSGQSLAIGFAAIGLAALALVIAVATGRGWRSAWWSRRADVAEGLAGAGAIAALVVASGLFRTLWELRFRV